ncbi:unnamed protein product [Caenorhabditis angaria]|uniref:DUF4781 domain-containing protein n=1 Tax=Caenorhabditis angaria TaxID=860376 RepID=A0A9P1IF93_9PELO|nr:unnamed protein product [Caenorhabditis angaria]
MGNNFAHEQPKSWDEEDVKKWMTDAAHLQKLFYTLFNGSQFDEYHELTDDQQISKICCAIYGPPEKEADDIENAYPGEQRNEAKKILDKIKEVCRESPAENRPNLSIGVVFVCCKQLQYEYTLPIFRLLYEIKDSQHISRYIDTTCRVYHNWDDWKENNNLPQLKYCYPERGFYSCSNSWKFEFDADKDPDISYGASPACKFSTRVCRTADTVLTTVGITLGLASMLTPAGMFTGPAMLGTIGGTALYGCGRAGKRLLDKAAHKENMKDLESAALMASIIAAPLSFVSCLTNARLAAGAAQGRMFSQGTRILATFVFFTTFSLDSFFLIVNISNLIEKAKNDQLTKLDVLQFSISCLFFANTLVQPKTANGVIEKAQQQRFDSFANGLSDEQAKVAFDKFLKNNEHGKNMQTNSKIIKTLNKIKHPDAFFKNNAGNDIRIGGKKGRTVFVTDAQNNMRKANPNEKIKFTMKRQEGAPIIQKVQQLEKCLGVDYKDHKYLKNMTNQQKGRVGKVFGGSAKYDKDIVDVATRISDDLNIQNADEFMSLIEIVAAEKHRNPEELFDAKFVAGVSNDLEVAANLAAKNAKIFADPFSAVYHYRKHGEDFLKNCSLDFYLGPVPEKIVLSGKLTDICNIETVHSDGLISKITRKTYYLPNDEMCVIMENPDKPIISTCFKNTGGWKKHFQKFPITDTTTPDLQTSYADFARRIGLQTIAVNIVTPTEKYKAEDYGEDAEYYQNMISLLLKDLARDGDESDFDSKN